MSTQAEITLFVGRRGTGKTTAMLNLLERPRFADRPALFYAWEDAGDERILSYPLVQTAKLSEVKSGRHRNKDTDTVGFLDAAHDRYRNGTLVLDDVGTILDLNRNGKMLALKRLLLRNRHIGLDVFLSFHDLAEVPTVVYRYGVNRLVLFNIPSDPKMWDSKIPDRVKIAAAWENLQKRLPNDPHAFEVVTF
jgi:hypothetical protein